MIHTTKPITGIKNATDKQAEIFKNGQSIMYACRNRLGNLHEKEMIKYNGRFYRVSAVNKYIDEFTEV